MDLSLCVVRDIDSRPLSITWKGNPGCVRSLDFSNNQNLDNDSSAIGKTFHSRSNCGFDNINRDNITFFRLVLFFRLNSKIYLQKKIK